MATSEAQNLADMANLIIEDSHNMLEVIAKLRCAVLDGDAPGELLAILGELSAAKAGFTTRAEEIMRR